jgi:hypothetical protein
MLTPERRAEIEEAIELLGWRRVVAHIPAMARELFAEIDRLNEVASDSSELAATTIAGLEREVASLQISLKVHIDGERRLRAEVFRLRAERESNERRY